MKSVNLSREYRECCAERTDDADVELEPHGRMGGRVWRRQCALVAARHRLRIGEVDVCVDVRGAGLRQSLDVTRERVRWRAGERVLDARGVNARDARMCVRVLPALVLAASDVEALERDARLGARHVERVELRELQPRHPIRGRLSARVAVQRALHRHKRESGGSFTHRCDESTGLQVYYSMSQEHL